MTTELIINNGTDTFSPAIEEGIEWSTERKGAPGKLVFKVLKSGTLGFSEGDAVRFKKDEANVFYGFVFKKGRDKDGIISVTAYDQMRYLKNKDTYVYTNKRADEIVRMIASDFGLQTGTLENTGYKIPSRVEDNVSLVDMFNNALDLTLGNIKQMFVLFDDFGKLSLKNIASMKLDLLIDEETGENFDYESSIDSETYNKVKLVRENEETGKREVFIARSSANINKWGVLQYFDTLSEGENGKAKSDALLKLYNAKTRNLSIKKAIGDPRVRAGSMVVVNLHLGDVELKNYMLVEKCKHIFNESEHSMDLTLRGGEFIA